MEVVTNRSTSVEGAMKVVTNKSSSVGEPGRLLTSGAAVWKGQGGCYQQEK